MNPNKYFSGYNLKNAGMKQKFAYMLKIVQFGREIFTLRPVAYITVDFKKLVSDVFLLVPLWWKANVSREKRGYQNSPKHNNSLETSPCAIQKHHAVHQLHFTLQIPS